MATFPILDSSAPDIEGFGDNYSDAARSMASFASGHPVVLTQHTFDPRTFSFSLRNVSQSDKLLIAAFYETYKDQEFEWVNDQDDTVYEVLFVQRPVFTVMSDDKELWKVDMVLVQATPTTLSAGTYTMRFYGGPAMVDIEDLAPGVSFTGRPVFALAMDTVLTSAHILTKGIPEGIDNSNTVVVVLKRNSDGATIVSKTYNTANQPPTNGLESLGTLLVTTLADDDFVTLDVTQTGTGDMPAFAIVLGGYFS